MKFKIGSLILLGQILVVNASDKLLSPRLHPPFEEPLIGIDEPAPLVFKDVRAAAGAPAADKPDTLVLVENSVEDSIKQIRIKAQTDPLYRALLAGFQVRSEDSLLPVVLPQIPIERCFSDSEPESTDSEGE